MKFLDMFKIKRSAIIAKSISPEESLIHAADLVISEIKKLSTRYHTAETEVYTLEKKLRDEKRRHYDKENVLKRLIEKDDPSIKDKARLVILLAKVIKRLEEEISAKRAMMQQLVEAGKQLKAQQESLADRLEYVREMNRAKALGINTEADVKEAVGITTVTVDDILMRIETFSGKNATGDEIESIDVEDYLNSLK